MHPGTVVSLEGLGHEGGVDAVLQRHLFDCEPESHDVVGHRQGIGVADDDLVLAGGHLVVGVLDRDSHQLEGIDGLAPILLGRVERSQIEVAAAIEHLWFRAGVGEIEELELGSDVEGEAEFGRCLQVALEDSPRDLLRRERRRG